MPVKAPVARPLTPSWAGFYIGGFVGGIFGQDSLRTPAQVVDVNPSGVTLGGLVGYNFQAANWVVGMEGDGAWTNTKASTNYVSVSSGEAETATDQSSYSAHLRARVGVAMGQWLPFIAGGVAFADDEVTLQHTSPARPARSLSRDLVGGTIGGGVDYMFARNWVGRVEYLFDYYGQSTYGFATPTAGEFGDRHVTTQQHTARAALIFKFD
jgi:outer membrane immunogenic protein